MSEVKEYTRYRRNKLRSVGYHVEKRFNNYTDIRDELLKGNDINVIQKETGENITTQLKIDMIFSLERKLCLNDPIDNKHISGAIRAGGFSRYIRQLLGEPIE